MILEPLQQYADDANGILVTWEYSGTADVTTFSIRRAEPGFQNDPDNYTEIDTVAYPQTYYIDTDGTFRNYYIIVETDDSDPVTELYSHPYIYAEEALLVADIYWELSYFLNLRCYRERLFFESSNRTIGRTSMGLWNTIPPAKVEIVAPTPDNTEGYQTIYRTTADAALATTTAGGDYPDGLRYDVDHNGRVYFYDYDGLAEAIKPYDEVFVTYNFRALTSRAINAALNQALQGILIQPGVSKGYTSVAQAPDRWTRAIISGAAGWLLRQLALQLMVPEPAIFFVMAGQPETAWQQANDRIDKMNQKSKEYLEEYWKMVEYIRIEQYPNTFAIVTPEFQLPGGRTRYFKSIFKS